MALFPLGVLGTLSAGCADEGPHAVSNSPRAMPSAAADASSAPSATGTGTARPDAGPPLSAACVQALAEPLPARIAVMTAVAQPSGASSSGEGGATPQAEVETLDQIYNGFWPASCSTCHPSRNSFQITSGSDLLSPGLEGFATKGEEALHHLLADGSPGSGVNEAMPQLDSTMGCRGLGGTKRAQTCPSDALVRTAQLLTAWVAAGKPSTFTLATTSVSGSGAGDDGGAASEAGAASSPPGYLMTPAVGNGLTNLGNCIPDKSIVGVSQSAMTALDAKFASMRSAGAGGGTPAQIIGLPEKLSETDLTTFDGEALARMGVIAFSPQYPLWSDDAGKLRHVRVPRGQSIRFDAASQEFDIPPNTRFYKTFLKRIIDTDGNESWRKIETRLIVSRPDTSHNGTAVQNALYGSYLWNPDETDASLVGTGDSLAYVNQGDTPLKDGTGFADTVLSYQTNVVTQTTRHYAVPSSSRCVDCHMGSPSQSFVLGFRPVQLLHRKVGQGGVIEASQLDEMTLLQRLIDAGIVTGMHSPDEVTPLELSQGTRLPRNNHELIAQGYMLGNCSHCHNPRGKPSVAFSSLRDILSFLPGPTGGIFQFPLALVSPRITRGYLGDVQIPYITPSLVDNPSFPPTLDPTAGDTSKQLYTGAIWRPTWTQSDGFVYAPWRSLIYRNVDTPFADTDDFVIYPHMPQNTPGYDNRARQILGDWMVSIAALRKRPDIDEYAVPYDLASAHSNCAETANFDPIQCLSNVKTAADPSVQPYVEVRTGDPGYAGAVQSAQDRLSAFHWGTRPGESLSDLTTQERYMPNPDPALAHVVVPAFADDDIVDPSVDPVCQPTPSEAETPLLNIPTHAHWVPIDLTVSSLDWKPRRSDWACVFENPCDPTKCQLNGTTTCGVPPEVTPICNNGAPPQGVDRAKQQCVINALKGDTTPVPGFAGIADPDCATHNYDQTVSSVTLDSVRAFATKTIPMGLWKEKPGCDWTREPWKSHGATVGEWRASDDHAWLDIPRVAAEPTRHVVEQLPGEAVFSMICINCHGPQADSKGRLADNIATMTGGRALVADFRDGLFGPRADPGAHYTAEFFNDGGAPSATADAAAMAAISAGDQAARYMAWMALGGTRVVIPPAFITILGQTPVVGQARHGGLYAQSANMLTIAHDLCLATLNTIPACKLGDQYLSGGPALAVKQTPPVIFENGDAELWLKLCSLNNPPPVFLVQKTLRNGCITPEVQTHYLPAPFLRGCDPNGPPCVGDENGEAHFKLTADNHHPWCMTQSDPNDLPVPPGAPVCPPGSPKEPGGNGSASDLWAQRGAMNAGVAVFLYLDAITKGTYPITHRNGRVTQGTYAVQPLFDACDQVTP